MSWIFAFLASPLSKSALCIWHRNQVVVIVIIFIIIIVIISHSIINHYLNISGPIPHPLPPPPPKKKRWTVYDCMSLVLFFMEWYIRKANIEQRWKEKGSVKCFCHGNSLPKVFLFVQVAAKTTNQVCLGFVKKKSKTANSHDSWYSSDHKAQTV